MIEGTMSKVLLEDISLKIHALKKQNNAPKKAPAWKTDVTLLDTALLFASVTPKSFKKESRLIVVPTNELS